MAQGLQQPLVSLFTMIVTFIYFVSSTLSRRVWGNRVSSVRFAHFRNIMLQAATRPIRFDSFNFVDSFKDLQKNRYYDSARIAKAKKIKNLSLEVFKKISTDKPVKCFCVSDLHVDSERNQIWVKDNCRREPEDSNNFTVIILPGDVGSECDRISRVFQVLTEQYDLVCFIPGNHELWRRGSAIQEADNNRMAVDSIAKMQEVLDLAQKYGVCTSPIEIQHLTGSVLVMPLHAWYHSSWDKEPEITHPLFLDVEKAIPFHRKWGDYSLCSWPSDLIEQGTFVANPEDNTVLAEAFAALNEPYLHPVVTDLNDDNYLNIFGCPQATEAQTVISFSHYLPRQELVPEKRFLSEPLLSKVIGSDVLEAQVRRLQPDVHLFGHTHIPMDRELEGIRYVQWPLGYYREAEKQCAAIYNSGLLLVYDSSLGQEKESIPKDIASKDTIWSRYYENNPRQPEIVDELAPWVISRLETFSGFVYTNKKREEQQQQQQEVISNTGVEESKGSLDDGNSTEKVDLVDGK